MIPGNASPLLLASAAAGAAAGVATKSLRFNSGDSASLTKTFSAGNRSIWTWSGWVKKTKVGGSQILFSSFTGSASDYIIFSNDTIAVQLNSSNNGDKITTRVLRDCSSWYHIVVAADYTSSTANDRIKIYVNGVLETDFSTNVAPSQNYQGFINHTYAHAIGSVASSTYLDGYLADVYFIDGSQLQPTAFGAYDDSGVWQAAAYSGTFGTNGFHLKFDDASSVAALGTDSSGNGNTFTVNNITLNKASVSSSTIANVAAGNAWNQSKTWSNLVSGPSQGYVSGNPITNGFDGSNSTLANASSAGGTMTFSAALGTGTFNVEMRFGNDQLYNGTTIDGVAPTSTSVANTIGHWTGLTSFNVMTMNSTGLANNARCCWNWIKVNGKFLVDSGNSGDPGGGPPDLTIANTTNFSQLAVHDLVQTNVSITAIDSSTSKISVSGGSWEGSNGSGTSGGDTTVTTVAVTNGDDVFDVPTNGDQSDTGAGGEVSGNYATLNPVAPHGLTLANGNLDGSGSVIQGHAPSTIFASSGKFYCEFTLTTYQGDTGVGVAASIADPDEDWIGEQAYMIGYLADGRIFQNSSSTSYSSYAAGDVIGVAFDVATGKVWFHKNGTYQNSGNPAAGTGQVGTITGGYALGVTFRSVGGAGSFNFGAAKFAHSAPSGFKALCTTNLPTPTIADGSDYFEAKTYTGNGSSQSITTSFSPDFVWIKQRNTAKYHSLYDIVRGTNQLLQSQASSAEVNAGSSGVTAFGSTSFTVGSDNGINQNGGTYVGWAWDAGSSTVTNTDGTITSSVRANQTAGFSIVKWTGTATAGTVGHGLGARPDLLIVKNYGESADWMVWHGSFGNGNTGQHISLNTTDAKGTGNRDLWNTTTHTNSLIHVGSDGHVNSSGKGIIAYCFSAVAGYSAFGSYTGNGSSTDGPFVHTGFRPRWVLIKATSITGQSWYILDAARDPHNLTANKLEANSSNAENASPNTATTNSLDLLSNGFKLRTSNDGTNQSNATYVYAAFAENPFQANGGLAR